MGITNQDYPFDACVSRLACSLITMECTNVAPWFSDDTIRGRAIDIVEEDNQSDISFIQHSITLSFFLVNFNHGHILPISRSL
jgi:hypothetical protein